MSIVPTEKMYHLFTKKGLYYVYDYNRIAIFQVGAQIYDLLVSIEHLPYQEAMSIICDSSVEYVEDLISLINDNYLFYSVTENDDVDNYINIEKKIEDDSIFTLSFLLGDKCNLSCDYCYYKNLPRASMTTNTNEIIQLLEKYSSTNKKIYLQLGTGGEPFLYKDSIIAILKKIKIFQNMYNCKIVPIIITNGTIYDKQFINILSDNNVALVFSLDGDKEAHDSARKYINATGTYDDIVANVSKITSDKNISRITKNIWSSSLVSAHTNSLRDNIIKLHEIGFETVQFKLVKGKCEDVGINKDNLAHFYHLYDELFDFLRESINKDKFDYLFMILNDGDTVGRTMLYLLSGNHNIKRCYAAKKMLCVDTDSKLYPCAFFNGYNYYLLGSTNDDKLDSGVAEKFSNLSIFSNHFCRICWASTICGGHCPYHSFETIGDINVPDPNFCLIMQMIIENVIHFINILETEKPDIYQKAYSYAKKRNFK